MKRGPRRVLLVLTVVVLGAAYFLVHQAIRPDTDPYPELRAADPERLNRILAIMEEERDLMGHPPGIVIPGATPIDLLAALRKRQPHATNSARYTTYMHDEEMETAGWFIASRRDPGLNDLLLRMLTDESLGMIPRKAALIGICWPGNEAVFPDLITWLFDLDVAPDLREMLLHRLDRIGGTPGARFHDLLNLPFDALDAPAAAALALLGEPVAPSLVLEGLESGKDLPDGTVHLCVRAAVRIAREDPEIVRLAQEAQPGMTKRSISIPAGMDTGEGMQAAQKKRWVFVDRVAEAFRRWLREHPEATDTAWENERASYRASERFSREERIFTWKEVSSTPDEEFDFAAAALAVACRSKEYHRTCRDRLDRLAAYFRPRLQNVATPEERLAILHETLLTRHMRLEWGPLEDGPSSFLPTVLRSRAGNCLGLTSLYVALGDRLDLPLVAVVIPRHVFLRWDDGKTRLDVELTDMGRIRTDEDLDGATPRVVTDRQLVSLAYSNRSTAWRESPWIRGEGRYRTAAKLAESAIQLDPANPAAHLALARALMQVSATNFERAMESVLRATELDPTDHTGTLVGAEILLGLKRPEESLEWYERALAAGCDLPAARAGRLLALQALDRHEEVLALADADEAARGRSPGIRRIRYRSLLHTGDPKWRGELVSIPTSITERWDMTLDTAEILLTDGRPVPPDPQRALELVRRLRNLAKEAQKKPELPGGIETAAFVEDTLLNRSTLMAYWKRARTLEAEALEKTGQADEARWIRRQLDD